MVNKFQLQKLRDLPIEGVAERLGLQVVRHKCLCPFHDDHHASLSFSTSRNTFRCFACGASGGTIDLAMRYLNKDFLEACRWLADEHNVILTEYHPKEPEASPKGGGWRGLPFYTRYFERPFLNEEARRFLFEERKLDERVVRWCRLTSWRDKQGIPWLQIPYYDQQGKLIGVQNRNLSVSTFNFQFSTSAPRFRFPRGSQCGIYNLPVLNRLKPGEDLYIAEGCSDCWSLLSAGHKAIAIPSATLLTQPVVEELSIINSQLSMLNVQWGMYPDRDLPGERLFLQLQKVLPNLQHHQLPPDCKDYSELYLKRNRPPLSPPSGGETGSGEAAAMSPPPYGGVRGGL